MAFMATLENIKVAGDQSNLSGVNHSILHGFNYSPPEADFPGWIQYGSFFNERNTWWPYFKNWADYKARISYLLQKGRPQANVAILQPLTDLWLKHGPQRDPFPKRSYPDYQDNLWEAINQNGGGCDYVSENIINNSTFKSGSMHYNECSYSTLLLPEIETLDLKTAQSLVEFAKAGGKIVFIEKQPFKSPSYKNGDVNDAEVKKMVLDLMEMTNVISYPAPTGSVITWYGELQDKLGIQAYVRFDKTNNYLSQATYKIGENSLFFIANTSLSEHISVKAKFNIKEKQVPWIWNPETGEKQMYPTNGNMNQIQLEIPRATSVLIMFEEENEGELFQAIEFNAQGRGLSGGWEVQLNHIDGGKQQLELEALSDLSKSEETKTFAGEIFYTKTINIESEEEFQYINLGDVQGVSELTLNDKFIGEKWYGSHIYKIDGSLKKGKNVLTIKLTTIIGNYLKGLKDNPLTQNWTVNQDYYPMGIMGPVTLTSLK
jgi:hypothetical protein